MSDFGSWTNRRTVSCQHIQVRPSAGTETAFSSALGWAQGSGSQAGPSTFARFAPLPPAQAPLGTFGAQAFAGRTSGYRTPHAGVDAYAMAGGSVPQALMGLITSSTSTLISAAPSLATRVAGLMASGSTTMLMPDPMQMLQSWISFAFNRGAGEISNSVVGLHIGSAGNDTINTNSLLSLAFGGAGNDTINGGIGLLFAHGGDGNDLIRGGNGIGNIMLGGNGNDVIQGGTALFNLAFGGAGNDTVVGGTSLFDIADGGDGNDRVQGGNGLLLSIAKGGRGNDIVTGGSSLIASAAFGDEGDDIVKAGFGLFHSGAHGGVGNDTVMGGTSVFHAGAYGDDGNDRVVGGDAWFTTAEGGKGDDYVTSGRGKNNAASGGEGADIVESSGRGKNQSLKGDEGNDILIARSGSEKVDGGAGFDTLHVPGSAREYALETNDKGEPVLVRYKLTKAGDIKLDDKGKPEVSQRTVLKGIEAIQFGSERIPVGKAVK